MRRYGIKGGRVYCLMDMDKKWWPSVLIYGYLISYKGVMVDEVDLEINEQEATAFLLMTQE